jgi:hypothetical protein
LPNGQLELDSGTIGLLLDEIRGPVLKGRSFARCSTS